MTRHRVSTDEWCFTFEDFRAMPFVRVCAALGISTTLPKRRRRGG